MGGMSRTLQLVAWSLVVLCVLPTIHATVTLQGETWVAAMVSSTLCAGIPLSIPPATRTGTALVVVKDNFAAGIHEKTVFLQLSDGTKFQVSSTTSGSSSSSMLSTLAAPAPGSTGASLSGVTTGMTLTVTGEVWGGGGSGAPPTIAATSVSASGGPTTQSVIQREPAR